MSKYSLYPHFENWSAKGSIWLYSDPHFSDDEMKYLRKNYIGDDEQVKRINSKVGKKDTIIFLGDIGNIDLIKKIRGYKILIKGNHDTGSANYKRKVVKRFICDDYQGDREQCEKDCIDNGGWIGDLGECEFCDLAHSECLDNHLFDEVYEGPLMISEKIILSHEPIPNINWALNIHGHDHSNREIIDNYHLNLCAEHIDYTPVCLKHIVESGVLKPIDSIHRITIDKATERKENRKKKEN